jgi:hypothetical protein
MKAPPAMMKTGEQGAGPVGAGDAGAVGGAPALFRGRVVIVVADLDEGDQGADRWRR